MSSDTVTISDNYEDIKGLWKQMTKDDWRYIGSHRKHFFKIWNCRKKAKKESEKFFGISMCSKEGTPCDAFRHCYGAALLVRAIGLNNARQFLRGHEIKPIRSEKEKREKERDLYNNKKGLEIGMKYLGVSDDHLAHICFQAWVNGKLKVGVP